MIVAMLHANINIGIHSLCRIAASSRWLRVAATGIWRQPFPWRRKDRKTSSDLVEMQGHADDDAGIVAGRRRQAWRDERLALSDRMQRRVEA